MLQRLLSPFREFGAAAGLCYVADRLLSMLSPRWRLYVYELMLQPIPDAALLPRRANATMEVREIHAGDPALALMPVAAPVVQARYAQRATCLGAFKKGELIGYMWFCPARYDEDEVRCSYLLEPPAESVFDYDFYIFPSHRMGRGFALLWDGANELLRARGVRQTFSRVSRFNLASRRAHQHLGGRRIGRAAFLCLGRLELMFATMPPYLHASRAAQGRAQLELRATSPR